MVKDQKIILARVGLLELSRQLSNRICERFHKTTLEEFYQVAFRKKIYEGVEQLQADL